MMPPKKRKSVLSYSHHDLLQELDVMNRGESASAACDEYYDLRWQWQGVLQWTGIREARWSIKTVPCSMTVQLECLLKDEAIMYKKMFGYWSSKLHMFLVPQHKLADVSALCLTQVELTPQPCPDLDILIADLSSGFIGRTYFENSTGSEKIEHALLLRYQDKRLMCCLPHDQEAFRIQVTQALEMSQSKVPDVGRKMIKSLESKERRDTAIEDSNTKRCQVTINHTTTSTDTGSSQVYQPNQPRKIKNNEISRAGNSQAKQPNITQANLSNNILKKQLNNVQTNKPNNFQTNQTNNIENHHPSNIQNKKPNNIHENQPNKQSNNFQTNQTNNIENHQPSNIQNKKPNNIQANLPNKIVTKNTSKFQTEHANKSLNNLDSTSVVQNPTGSTLGVSPQSSVSGANKNPCQKKVVSVLTCGQCGKWKGSQCVYSCTCQLICGACVLSHPSCLQCQQPFTANTKVGELFARVAAVITHPCRHEGCPYLIKPGDTHEASCKFKPFTCYLCREPVPTLRIKRHLELDHPQKVLLSSSNTNVTMADFWTDPESGEQLLSCFTQGRLFWFNLICNTGEPEAQIIVESEDHEESDFTTSIKFEFQFNNYSCVRSTTSKSKEMSLVNVPMDVISDWGAGKCALDLSVVVRRKRKVAGQKTPTQKKKLSV